jgi:hypothetical protein
MAASKSLTGATIARRKKKRARVSRPASLLQVAWSKPPVGGKPMLESEQEGAQQSILTFPLMLEQGYGIDIVVVGEHV